MDRLLLQQDLQDLRRFIAAQKARLEAERSALQQGQCRGRGSSPHPPADHQELFSAKNDGARSTNHNNNVVDLTQIEDAFCKRIDNLSDFKDQVCLQSKEYEEYQYPTAKSAQTESEEVKESGEENQVFLDLQPETVLMVDGSKNFESFNETKTPLKINVLDDSGKETTKDFRNQKTQFSSSLSREEEVLRLQEKLSSAPFWEGFGASATSKQWSPNTADRMVRIGEFSPSNPDLQAPGKALLGLGEYEERRRHLLEKKKQEYKDYLSQNRNTLQKTDHLQHPITRSHFDLAAPQIVLTTDNLNGSTNSVDAATQTESLPDELPYKENSLTTAEHHLITQPGDSPMQPLSPREKLNMELQHHCAPCFVPRAHASQTTEQLPDARMRQLQLQEELRLQIEEKRKLEAERREQERKEEEALQKRVAEQQARLQAEYERDEKLRRDREIQKQQHLEEFQKRQEELKAEAEALKQEGRRQKLNAAEMKSGNEVQPFSIEIPVGAKNAHLVPPSEPASVSILRSTSPPLHSPRRAVQVSEFPDDGPPSPRALIKVLEGPTLPPRLEDSLPIPLMPVVHANAQPQPSHRSPHRPRRSPTRAPHRSPQRSPTRFIPEQDWNVPVAPHHHPSIKGPSQAMRNLEERWKVPAVQKNVCVRGKPNPLNGGTNNVLTQLGAFRQQLQIEHMRMEEKVKERHHPHHYNQQYYQQHIPKRNWHDY